MQPSNSSINIIVQGIFHQWTRLRSHPHMQSMGFFQDNLQIRWPGMKVRLGYLPSHISCGGYQIPWFLTTCEENDRHWQSQLKLYFLSSSTTISNKGLCVRTFKLRTVFLHGCAWWPTCILLLLHWTRTSSFYMRYSYESVGLSHHEDNTRSECFCACLEPGRNPL